MRAIAGDRLVIKGHRVGEHDNDAEILEVRGPDGGPPYVVRWSDTGHETLFFPGSDAFVQHLGSEPPPAMGIVEGLQTGHRVLRARLEALRAAADALTDDVMMLPDSVHEAYHFLSEEVLPHAAAEDKALYPLVGELLGSPAATATMSREHLEIARLTAELGGLRETAFGGIDETVIRDLRRVLYGLDALLSLHLTEEEDVYLPLLATRLPTVRSAEVYEAVQHAEARPHAAVVPA
jgi:iron-sulfur cluster repair protein YtfE (RIC family)